MFIIKMKLTVEAIPTPKGFQHPAAKYDALPRHEFSMGLIAPKDLIKLINVVEKRL
jgi:hypothetical protein